MTPALKPCPLCHSPHTNVARNLEGDVEQGFCKVCGCAAPIAAWNKRSVGSSAPLSAIEILNQIGRAHV